MFQLKNIFSKKPNKTESSKSYGIVYNSFAENTFLGQMLVGGEINDYKALSYYRETAAISTAIDIIASAAEQIPLRLKDTQGNFIPSSKVLDFLENPNPAEDYRTFIGDAIRNFLITGNSYFITIGNTSREPLQLWSCSPQNLTIVENGFDNYPGSFLIAQGGPYRGDYSRKEMKKDWRYITSNNLQEITQIRTYSSKSSKLKGDSPLESIMRDINQQIAGKIHNAAVLQNGGNVSLVAIFKDKLGADQMLERKLALQSEIGGAHNSGKIAVVQSSDVEFKDFSKQSNKDMDFVNLDKISTDTIFKRYNIPLALVSLDASTYNNYEQARIDLFDRAVLPNFDVVTGGLSRTLLPRFGIDPRKFKLTYNPENIPALRYRVLNELKLRREIAIETINELRGLLPSREAIGPEGDIVYQSKTLVPLTDSTEESSGTEEIEGIEETNS